MSVKLKNGLTAMEETFCQLLAKDMSQTEAYTRAGYKASSYNSAATMAGRLLKKVHISERVNALKAEIAERSIQGSVLTAQLVHETLLRVIQEGLKPIPVAVKGELAEKCADLPSVVAATKLSAQLLNMLVDRQSVELTADAKQALERMVQVIATEVPDPAVRERIIARLSGDQANAAH